MCWPAEKKLIPGVGKRCGSSMDSVVAIMIKRSKMQPRELDRTPLICRTGWSLTDSSECVVSKALAFHLALGFLVRLWAATQYHADPYA